jgi:hypothetical protein
MGGERGPPRCRQFVSRSTLTFLLREEGLPRQLFTLDSLLDDNAQVVLPPAPVRFPNYPRRPAPPRDTVELAAARVELAYKQTGYGLAVICFVQAIVIAAFFIHVMLEALK